jgi:hypothetical protein
MVEFIKYKNAFHFEQQKRITIQQNFIREQNKKALQLRLYKLAADSRIRHHYDIRAPAHDADYSEFGIRLFTHQEIDIIIRKSGLVQRKQL